ncbi:MAG: DinB family protein [Acidimicrobiales bacterium]
MAPDLVRDEPPFTAGELASLTAWLDYQRCTLRLKCDGLTGEQMVQPSVPPSGLTLLGLVQHMTLVEWWWFEHIFDGGATPQPYLSEDDPDYEFHALDPGRAEAALRAFVSQCAHSRAIVGRAESLDARSTSPERHTRDLRWIMVHMIEEYARHNGHADLLRECIDGTVGD